MFYLYFLILLVVLYWILDVNYFLRTYFTVLSGRLYQQKCSLNDVTTIYGLCTLKDCDVLFGSIRLARLVRELDFARYHFYDRTDIYRRSRDCKIKSLQGCTLTVTMETVPLFAFYKINTKLIYWDERSLFFEHEVVTLQDCRVRCLLISRQYAIGENGESTGTLLTGLPGSDRRQNRPDYIEFWLDSMQISSSKLRN